MIKTRKLMELPRTYLSYSQYILWNSNKQRYKANYFNQIGTDRIQTQAMSLGSKVADSLENYEDTGDLLMDSTLTQLIKYDVRDKEFYAFLNTSKGSIMLIAKPDTMDSQTFAFREYKTSQTKWTQEKVDTHIQLLWYATCIYLVHKVVPPSIWLDVIETERITKTVNILGNQMEICRIEPTGKIYSFERKVSLADILAFVPKILGTAKAIEQEWTLFKE
jgi:hypothetical protein